MEKAGRVSYIDRWTPVEARNNLRRVAGTGDFRIRLMQTNGGSMGKWHVYQVRVRGPLSPQGGEDASREERHEQL